MDECSRELIAREGGWLSVKGWSMWPIFKPGNIIKINTNFIGTLKPGDVVAFSIHNKIFAHRLLWLDSQGHCQTAGDNRLRPDQLIQTAQIIGRVDFSHSYWFQLLNTLFSYLTRFRFYLLGYRF